MHGPSSLFGANGEIILKMHLSLYNSLFFIHTYQKIKGNDYD